MNPSPSTVKQKLANSFVMFTAIWSSAIMPVIPSYAKMLDNNDLPSLGSDNVISEDNSERFIAEHTKTLGSFLSQKKTTKDLSNLAQDYARNKAANEATKEIENWLSKAGHAKLSINIDKKLSVKNSQLDWMIPWYEQPNTLIFTQHSIHRVDGRLQANNGVGLRRFNEKNTVGINTFIDHDLSHYHTRAGIGVEYWQDYLKLNANTYLRISSWKSASELNHDFNARPANGWDLQAEGWLPAYPHLGGNLKYEQYYGDSVALFGKTKRQKNPKAATFGAHWTPFPLLTLNANHKIGSQGKKETQAKIQFTWTLGKSLAHHLDPTKVAEARRLSGNRYDFVERNNNIILDYQKKTLLHLALPTKIQGETGQAVPLVKSFTSKYPLKHIVWQAPELLAAGGSISSTDQTATVILPTYKTANTPEAAQKLNRYHLQGTAFDNKGNASPVAETLIEVTNAGVISINPSDIKFQGKGLANGNDVNSINVVVRDSHGNVVPNAKVVFVLPNALTLASEKTKNRATAYSEFQRNLQKKMQAMKVSKPWEYTAITNAKGEAKVQFTSQIAGIYEIGAYTGSHQPVKTQVIFKPDIAQAYIRSLTVQKTAAIANGISENKLKAYVTDTKGNPIAGQKVIITATNSNITSQETTNEQGVIDIILTSLKTGLSEVTATINGQSETAAVHFINDQLSDISITNISKAFAGEKSAISLKLTDKHGNPVSGADGTINAYINQVTTPITIWEINANSGEYGGSLPGQKQGDHIIQLDINGIISPEEIFTVLAPSSTKPLNPDGSGTKGQLGVVDKIELNIKPGSRFKSGDEPLIIVTLTDAFDNELDGIDFDKISLGNRSGDSLGWYADGNGDYATYFPLTTLGTIDITASINGIFGQKTEIIVNNATGNTHVDTVNITEITKTPNAGDKPAIKVELTDKNGHHVNGVQAIEVTVDGTTHTVPVAQQPDGSYTAELPAQQSGLKDVVVSVNGLDSNTETLHVQNPTPIAPNTNGQQNQKGVVSTVTLSATPTAGLKSGDIITLTVRIQDHFANPLTGLTSHITLAHNQAGTVTWVDHQDGTYSAPLTLTKLGDDPLKATVQNVDSHLVNLNVANLTGNTHVDTVNITEITKTPNAGDKPAIKVELTDKNGHHVNGVQAIEVTVDGTTHTVPVAQQPDGSYTAELPAQQSGLKDVVVSVNGLDSNTETLHVQNPTPIAPNTNGQQNQKGVVSTVTLSATPTAGLKSGDIITLTVRIQDHFANPLTGLTSHITLAHNQAGTVTWVDHQDGTYSAPLTLTKLGDDPLKATVQNVDSQSMAIIVEPQQSKTSVNTVELHTLHPLVSVGQAATLTLTLLDKHNNGVVQIPSNEIKLENNKLTLSNIQWQEQGDGVYTTELPFSQIGNQKLISTVNFIESQSVDVDVTALKGATRVHRVTLDATPKQLVVGESTQLTLTLLDQFNNGVLDVLESDININDDNTRSTLTGLQWQYQQNGVYTANALITKGGVHSLKATVNNKQDNVLIHAISSVGQSYVNDAVLTSNTMNIIAGNSTTLMLKLKDQHGNPVSQVASSDITLTDSSGATIQTHWNEMNNLGDYHASIQLDIVGSHTLAVTTNNIARNIQIQVTAAQGASSVAQLEIAPIATTEAGEKTSIAVTMKDQYGNIVNNVLNRDITIEIGGITYPIQLTELSDTGQYTGQIPAQPQGQHAVKITVNTHSKTTNWNVNNPTTIPLSSFDKTGQRGALETATLSHNKNLVGSGDKVTFTLTLMDKFDNPLTGASPQLRLLTNLSEVSLWQDNRDGSYSIELLMNRLGSQNVQAIVKNMLSNDINLNIAALSGANNVDTTALTIRDATIEAGNTTQLTLLLKDSVDNGVTQVQNGDIHLTQNSVKTDKLWSSVIDGIYTTPIQINKVGIYPLRATVNKQNSRIETLEVTHPHGQAKVANAQLVSNIASLDAGKDVELTLTLKDQYDNLVIGINGADIALKDSHTTEVIDNSRIAWHMASEGIYKASLPLTLIGNHMLTATVNHQSASTSQITINPLKGTANVNQIMLTAAQNAISAGETTMLTLSVLDSFGNEVSDVLTSDISLTNADAQITTLATWTKVPSTVGTYAASVQLDKVMAHTLIAKVNGQTKTTQIHVNPLKNFDNVTTVSLQTPSTTEVDEKNKLTLTLTDRFGNGVVDVDPRHISLTLGSVAQVVTWIEDQNGTYHTELALSQVGNQSITVKVNNATETKAVRVNSPAGKDKVVSIQFATTTTSVLPNESVTLTLTLKDQHGNSVKNVRSSDISLSDSHIPESFTSPNWAEDSQQIGVYTAVVNLKKTAEHTLTAKVNNLEKGTKITVQPFTGVQQVNIVELSVDKKEISIGGKVNFTLTAKDIYGNNVSIQTADIRLQNANDAINQPTWQQQGLQFKGELTLSTSGSYVITAKVGDKTSSPTNLTVQSGKPVFAAGKSEFSVSSHEIDEGSNANITVKLVLKDASGNPILGKRPRVSASAGTIANTMQENNYGVYTSTFKNNAIGKSNLTLDSASIDYNDTVPPITVITYGSSKIIAQSHSFSMSDEFPNTGFKGAKFQITVPIGQQTDYDWSVDIDWLSIDDKGVVTMRHKPIPIRNGNAMIPIFKGVPKPHTGYKRTVDYRFTLKKWYDSHGKMGAFASRNTCIAPSRLIKYNDLSIGRSYSRQVGEQVFQEWGAKFTQDHLGINSFFWTADTQTNTKNSIYNPFSGVDQPVDISNSQSLDAICVDDLN